MLSNGMVQVLINFILKGPPPDPQYNFLSDRTRDKPRVDQKDKKQGEKENRNGDWNNNNNKDTTRRHPKNFGGTDFNNVKGKMKEVKERQVCVKFWLCEYFCINFSINLDFTYCLALNHQISASLNWFVLCVRYIVFW